MGRMDKGQWYGFQWEIKLQACVGNRSSSSGKSKFYTLSLDGVLGRSFVQPILGSFL